MQFELAKLRPKDRYKLLAGFIVPRPIALVSTRGPDGIDNAAPFSSFNYLGEDPPVVVLGLEVRPDGTEKDTTRNIRETGEFVVNFVDETLLERQNVCAVHFPRDVSEASVAGLTLAPSTQVEPQRIVESPVAMECRRLVDLEFGIRRTVVVGEVLWVHARDDLVDPETYYVSDAYRPVGRIYGSRYVRLTDLVELPRVLAYEEWLKNPEPPRAKPVAGRSRD